jgi:Resolvase, N terminal domain
LVAFLAELHAKGVDLYLHQQGIDTGTPAGKAMFQMMGVFAEFERGIIVERVKAGLERARSQGKRLGRRPVSENVVARIREKLATGVGILRVSQGTRCGHRNGSPGKTGFAQEHRFCTRTPILHKNRTSCSRIAVTGAHNQTEALRLRPAVDNIAE